MHFEDTSRTTSLKLLGDFWTLRIIDALADGDIRFCDLQRTIDNCNPVTLTDRLKKLEEAKLLTRTEASDNCVVYSLTDLGKNALPVIAAIDTFTRKSQA